MKIRMAEDAVRATTVIGDIKRAENILEKLNAHVQKHGYVSINMLFDLIHEGLDPDSVLGWRDLDSAVVYKSCPDNCIRIEFPPIEEIFWKEIVKDYDR